MSINKTPWIVLLLLWMGGSTWWHVCKIKQLCGDDAPTIIRHTANFATSGVDASGVSTPGLTIADGDKLNLTVAGNFSYAKSGDEANTAALGNTLQTVADYLKASPDRIMTVMGHYHADEANPGSYPNLGIARAEAIKADLVNLGVPAAQVATASMLVGTPDGAMMPYSAKGDSLYGGLAFSFTGKSVETSAAAATTATTVAKPKTDEALAEGQKFTSVFKPIDLYFRSGQSGYIKTEDTKKFFAEAEKYLKANKDKKLVMTGHTDDTGSERVNLELSRARANGVKSRLRNDGINGDQITVEAKGESQPKESNDTAEGRKANRRVTVVVQ